MSFLNRLSSLATLASVLFVASLGLYLYENRLIESPIQGRDLIQGLDIAQVHKIRIKDQKKEIVLTKEGSRFVLENRHRYMASNEKVNDLLFNLASIKIKERSDINEKKAELGEEARSYDVKLYDANDKTMVSVQVGKSIDGSANYVKNGREDDVFVSEETVRFSLSDTNYINKLALKVGKDDISEITVKSSKSFTLLRKELEQESPNPLKDSVEGATPGEKKQTSWAFSEGAKAPNEASVAQLVDAASSVNINDFLLEQDDSISELQFDQTLILKTKNQVVYFLEFAQKDKEYFVKMNARTGDLPKQVQISRQDSQEELKKVEDLLVGQDLVKNFNLRHSGWVYKISKAKFEALMKKRADLEKGA